MGWGPRAGLGAGARAVLSRQDATPGASEGDSLRPGPGAHRPRFSLSVLARGPGHLTSPYLTPSQPPVSWVADGPAVAEEKNGHPESPSGPPSLWSRAATERRERLPDPRDAGARGRRAPPHSARSGDEEEDDHGRGANRRRRGAAVEPLTLASAEPIRRGGRPASSRTSTSGPQRRRRPREGVMVPGRGREQRTSSPLRARPLLSPEQSAPTCRPAPRVDVGGAPFRAVRPPAQEVPVAVDGPRTQLPGPGGTSRRHRPESGLLCLRTLRARDFNLPPRTTPPLNHGRVRIPDENPRRKVLKTNRRGSDNPQVPLPHTYKLVVSRPFTSLTKCQTKV